MARELQNRVIEVVHSIYGGEVELESAPEWMMRPGRAECRRRWLLLQRIYAELTALDLPEAMPTCEHRRLDAVLRKRGRAPLVLEVDEKQHFNGFRARTLRAYPRSVQLAFPKRLWIQRCEEKKRLEGGGSASRAHHSFQVREGGIASAPSATPWPTSCRRRTAGSRPCGSPTSRSRIGSTTPRPRNR